MIVKTATARQFDPTSAFMRCRAGSGLWSMRSMRIECCQLHDLKQVPPSVPSPPLASGVAEEQSYSELL